MQLVSFPAKETRKRYRHPLRALTCITLDDANSGIIRNLSSAGASVQAVAALRPQQRTRLRFELRSPRLRVEAHGQVSWAESSGQCGIRFVDLPAQTARKIDEWIFSDLLVTADRLAAHPDSIFTLTSPVVSAEQRWHENDGLAFSPPLRGSIKIEQPDDERNATPHYAGGNELLTNAGLQSDSQSGWLSQPLSARTLAWLVDGLVMLAGLLLFALIFLSIAHELPPWPLAVGAGLSAAALIFVGYRLIGVLFGGSTLGTRLAGVASGPSGDPKTV